MALVLRVAGNAIGQQEYENRATQHDRLKFAN